MLSAMTCSYHLKRPRFMYYLVVAIGPVEQLICVPLNPLGLSCPPNVKQLDICDKSSHTPSQQFRQQERFISMSTKFLTINLVPQKA